ncbi:WbuC family cupin fold metalloprotein [Petrimonas sp.]|uniref:WbuC family cupin fold metalloprotein n=1 Tax=Petrimonas sp. TaxID=2023866 RepID=UPI003F50D78E
MLLNHQLLEEITEQARQNPRLRMNYNLHDSLDAKAQRLFNAMEPGTVLPVHRHRNTSETYILIRGAIRVLLYDDNKTLISSYEISDKNDNFGFHIPKGQWHTLEVLESGTVIFEVKEGPYAPLSDEDILVIENGSRKH